MGDKVLLGMVIGSDSDWEIVKPGVELLKEFCIGYELRVLSAHRTPDELREYVRSAERRGIKVLIGAAGFSAHLPGVMASYTRLPVIGVPTQGLLGGVDALLSIVQMPAGVPVATMGIGSGGARNAVLFAIRILSLSDEGIRRRFLRYQNGLKRSVKEKEEALLKKV